MTRWAQRTFSQGSPKSITSTITRGKERDAIAKLTAFLVRET